MPFTSSRISADIAQQWATADRLLNDIERPDTQLAAEIEEMRQHSLSEWRRTFDHSQKDVQILAAAYLIGQELYS